MIGRLRRWRLLTLVLLLATPGLAGTALGALHPCPESTPWVANAGGPAGAHAGHGGDHQDSRHGDDASGHGAECHCVGACAAAAATLPLVSPLPTAIVSHIAPTVLRAPSAVVPALRPSDRLPPATAPPLA